jgi:hypothetical protein
MADQVSDVREERALAILGYIGAMPGPTDRTWLTA